MKTSAELYNDYKSRMHRIADLKSANAVLQWDQETGMPAKGAHFRGQQISTLSEMAHEAFSDDAFGELLRELADLTDLPEDAKRNVELTLEDYRKSKKYSSAFVRKLSTQINKTFHAWIEARKQNSFAVYEADLDTLVQLKKEEAKLLGYADHPYDALLDEYEKGATVAMLDNIFSHLLPQLKSILEQIAGSPQVDDTFLRQHFPKQQQWDWGMKLIKDIGFDFEAGRQDISEHPFSTSFSPRDVRITTRIDEGDFGNMTWSCIHETGHALYEQGLLEENYGLPMGEACSYSIHESQSRLWENSVGRSATFWNHYFTQLLERFPQQLGGLDARRFYRGINKVQPSLIRTEADEITYHFHVYIRYELEKGLIGGTISTKDIPRFWNEQYRKWLGLSVPDDKRGCLQDVHWSHGSFGYFPTYSLGSFYAAQFFAKAADELQSLKNIRSPESFRELLSWLRQNIHQYGRKYSSEDLCKRVTAQSLDEDYFLEYIRNKFGNIYKFI